MGGKNRYDSPVWERHSRKQIEEFLEGPDEHFDHNYWETYFSEDNEYSEELNE